MLHPFEMGVIVVIGRLDSWVGARFPECKDIRCAIFTNADEVLSTFTAETAIDVRHQ